MIGNHVWDVALKILAKEDVRLAHVFDGAKVTYWDNFESIQIITDDPAALALSPPVVKEMFRRAFKKVVRDVYAKNYEDANWPKVSVESSDLTEGIERMFGAPVIEEDEPTDVEDAQAELAAIAAAPQPEKATLKLYCPVAGGACDREDDCRRGNYCAKMAQSSERATSQIQSGLVVGGAAKAKEVDYNPPGFEKAATITLDAEDLASLGRFADTTLTSLKVIRDALKASLDVMDREIEKLEGK